MFKHKIFFTFLKDFKKSFKKNFGGDNKFKTKLLIWSSKDTRDINLIFQKLVISNKSSKGFK